MINIDNKNVVLNNFDMSIALNNAQAHIDQVNNHYKLQAEFILEIIKSQSIRQDGVIVPLNDDIATL